MIRIMGLCLLAAIIGVVLSAGFGLICDCDDDFIYIVVITISVLYIATFILWGTGVKFPF